MDRSHAAPDPSPDQAPVADEATDGGVSIAPFCYENWEAAARGAPSSAAYENPIFSDAQIVGTADTGYEPYQLINTISGGDRTRPALILRVEDHRTHPVAPLRGEKETNTGRYHGGDLADEIAALVSLCLGIRAQSGNVTRVFEPGGDPRGTPVAYGRRDPDPLVPPPRPTPILPRELKENTHNLDALAPLADLLSLTPLQAVELVRAARSYQEAMWIAEGAPETAWLLFISALETAANRWRSEEEDPTTRLHISLPAVEGLLRERGGDALVAEVAELLAPSLAPTTKFINFVLAFLPKEPMERPPAFYQLSWKKSDMRRSLSKIYQHRSDALHGGIPFPLPMCDPPWIYDGVAAEIPAYTHSTLGAVWNKDDLPMFLHTFEYITRYVLLNWWRSLIETAQRDSKADGVDNAVNATSKGNGA